MRKRGFFCVFAFPLILAWGSLLGKAENKPGGKDHEVILFLEEWPDFPAAVQVGLLKTGLHSTESILHGEMRKAGIPLREGSFEIRVWETGNSPFVHLTLRGDERLEASLSKVLKLLGGFLQKVRDQALNASLGRKKEFLQRCFEEQARLQKERTEILLQIQAFAGSLHLEGDLVEMEEKVREAKASLGAAEKERIYLEKLSGEEKEEIVASRTVDSSLTNEIKQQIQRKETDLRELRLKFTDEFPAVIKVKEEMQKLKERLSLVNENPVYVETLLKNPRLEDIQALQLETELRIFRLQEEFKSLSEDVHKKRELLPQFQPLREKADSLLRILQSEEEEELRLKRRISEIELSIKRPVTPLILSF